MNNPISITDLAGRKTSDFIVWDGTEWISLDFRNTNMYRFLPNYENNYIEQTIQGGTVIARYTLNGDVIQKVADNRITPYAYRKLYDMEIHDIGVVYCV